MPGKNSASLAPRDRRPPGARHRSTPLKTLPKIPESKTEEHPVSVTGCSAGVENDSEQYRLQSLLDVQPGLLEEHAAEHGWGAGELEAAMLLSMTNYQPRARPVLACVIRRLEDGLAVGWRAAITRAP